MADRSKTATENKRHEVVYSRIIDAPRAMVYEAWTDPGHVAQWMGPPGYTNPVCEMDVRPGGKYRIVSRSPNGVEYPAKGVYIEVKKPERIVSTDNWEEYPAEWRELLAGYQYSSSSPKELLWTVTFDEIGNKTRLTVRTQFASAGDLEAMLKVGMDVGWNQSLDRLESHLAKMKEGKRS